MTNYFGQYFIFESNQTNNGSSPQRTFLLVIVIADRHTHACAIHNQYARTIWSGQIYVRTRMGNIMESDNLNNQPK